MNPSNPLELQGYAAVLGVQYNADLVTIKKAYKSLALAKHPDKNGGTPESTAEFQRIQHAYEKLSAAHPAPSPPLPPPAPPHPPGPPPSSPLQPPPPCPTQPGTFQKLQENRAWHKHKLVMFRFMHSHSTQQQPIPEAEVRAYKASAKSVMDALLKMQRQDDKTLRVQPTKTKVYSSKFSKSWWQFMVDAVDQARGTSVQHAVFVGDELESLLRHKVKTDEEVVERLEIYDGAMKKWKDWWVGGDASAIRDYRRLEDKWLGLRARQLRSVGGRMEDWWRYSGYDDEDAEKILERRARWERERNKGG